MLIPLETIVFKINRVAVVLLVVIFGPAWDRAYLVPFLTKSLFLLKNAIS